MSMGERIGTLGNCERVDEFPDRIWTSMTVENLSWVKQD
jgi:hypothetical protein